MANGKKRTSVVLPQGLQGLVHNLQNGQSPAVRGREDEDQKVVEEQQTVSKEVATQQPNTAATPSVAPADAPQAEQPTVKQDEKQVETPVAKQDEKQVAATTERETVATETSSADDLRPQMGTPTRAALEDGGREYHVIKDDTDDSWELFLDMAQKYKRSDSKLATIYIDPELKSVLDRLKYAGSERLPTSAILSSIVARFIYDHEEEIRKIIFGGKLI